MLKHPTLDKLQALKLIWKTFIMKGTSASSSNQSLTASRRIEGAKGLNDSLRLIDLVI